MSRVGKLPITLPAKVEVTLAAKEITVKGPLGTLTQALSSDVVIKKDGDKIVLEAASGSQQSNAMSGTMRALLANMVIGVEKGFEKKLLLVGVGYKAAAQGTKLNLTRPAEHVVPDAPEGGGRRVGRGEAEGGRVGEVGHVGANFDLEAFG